MDFSGVFFPITTKSTRWVWPISRECLLLLHLLRGPFCSSFFIFLYLTHIYYFHKNFLDSMSVTFFCPVQTIDMMFIFLIFLSNTNINIFIDCVLFIVTCRSICCDIFIRITHIDDYLVWHDVRNPPISFFFNILRNSKLILFSLCNFNDFFFLHSIM